MSSPPSPTRNTESIPLAGTEVHGLKRSRDTNTLGQTPDTHNERRSPNPSVSVEVGSDIESEAPNQVGHPPTPLAKKGRRFSKCSDVEQTSPPTTRHSQAISHSHTSSNGGSDHDHSKSRVTTPEATEVKSVRKKVEGMGVENDQEQAHDGTEVTPQQQNETSSDQPGNEASISSTTVKSDALPASWASYNHSESPFMIHAPKTNVSIFSSSDDVTSDQTSDPTPVPSSNTGLARAFAVPHSTTHKSSSPALHPTFSSTITGSNSLASASPNFPCGSDFFLKGKRNNCLASSQSGLEPGNSTQNKKAKLPEATGAEGFAAYSHPTSLKPAALDKLNNNEALQIPSLSAPHLNVKPISSAASSVCAVNGDSDGIRSPPLSTSSAITSFPQSRSNPSHLGFSSFSQSSAFGVSPLTNGNTNWTSSTPSVFDQPATSQSGEQSEDGAQGPEKKTHLALAADLGGEDKHAGFGAKELITGEENENLVKSVRCKVFTLEEDGTWHERGSGGLRLLRNKSEPSRYRLIMRADAVHRVLLNVPIFKGFSYVASQEKFLSFASTVVNTDPLVSSTSKESGDGGETTSTSNSQFQKYLCKFSRTEARQEMIDSIQQCLTDLASRPDLPSTKTDLSTAADDD